MALALPIEDFHGYVDEDLLLWLTKFEDHFNITRDSKVQPTALDSGKASHLIAKFGLGSALCALELCVSLALARSGITASIDSISSAGNAEELAGVGTAGGKLPGYL